MAEDKVNTPHPLYNDLEKLRKVYLDVIAGTNALRLADSSSKGYDHDAYLPKFPRESGASYELRRSTATLLNVTAKTRESLCGLVFQSDITLKDTLPEIEKWAENIDNTGNHLNVFARQVFEDSFDGYSAILVDHPPAGNLDLAQEQEMGIRPYWVAYRANAIINWDYQINPVSKRKELSLLVLREYHTKRTGTFVRETEVFYRVFEKNETKITWQLWKEDKDATGTVTNISQVPNQGGTIANQTQIPVAIIGELGDKPPLMDLAYKNLEHYQTYSDYKSILHKTCVPLFYTVGLQGEPEAIGGDIWFKLQGGTTGSAIGFAEPSGSSIDKVQQALEDIKMDMSLLGLAMLQSKKVQGDVTATEKMLDSIQETSALQVRATQLKDALETAMGFTAKYIKAGNDKGGSVDLGATWNQLVLTPQEIQTYSTLVSTGHLSIESFLWFLEKSGKLPPDVDAEMEQKRLVDPIVVETEEEGKAAAV